MHSGTLTCSPVTVRPCISATIFIKHPNEDRQTVGGTMAMGDDPDSGEIVVFISMDDKETETLYRGEDFAEAERKWQETMEFYSLTGKVELSLQTAHAIKQMKLDVSPAKAPLRFFYTERMKTEFDVQKRIAERQAWREQRISERRDAVMAMALTGCHSDEHFPALAL